MWASGQKSWKATLKYLLTLEGAQLEYDVIEIGEQVYIKG